MVVKETVAEPKRIAALRQILNLPINGDDVPIKYIAKINHTTYQDCQAWTTRVKCAAFTWNETNDRVQSVRLVSKPTLNTCGNCTLNPIHQSDRRKLSCKQAKNK